VLSSGLTRGYSQTLRVGAPIPSISVLVRCASAKVYGVLRVLDTYNDSSALVGKFIRVWRIIKKNRVNRRGAANRR